MGLAYPDMEQEQSNNTLLISFKFILYVNGGLERIVITKIGTSEYYQ